MGYENKGDNYESLIHTILMERGLTKQGRGGASDKPDVQVNLKNSTNINIECKVSGADYGQKSILYINSRWNWAKPDNITSMYDQLKILNYIDSGFIPKNANHLKLSPKEWGKQKKRIIGNEEKFFDQRNFEKTIPEINIRHFFEFYKLRNTFYLQLKDSGLYHLSEDRFKIGTEQYNGKIKLRFRAKSIHAHEYWVNGKKVKSRKEFNRIKNNEIENPSLFPNEYKTTPKPWHYGFYAVIKESEEPTKSKYSIDPDSNQHFPDFSLI